MRALLKGLWAFCSYLFVPQRIDHFQITYQEKEYPKYQMKQILEVYIQGVKDIMDWESRNGVLILS